MTSARNVLVADWCSHPMARPIGVYGPTRKTRSRPMTSGGSSRLHSTPVSHTRGKGSFPRASIQPSGVQTTNSTPRVTSPDSSDVTSGSSAPGAVRELAMALPDRLVAKAITGPSRASQITPAPATDTHAETERSLSGAAPTRRGAAGLAAQLTRYLCGHRACRPGYRRGRQVHLADPDDNRVGKLD